MMEKGFWWFIGGSAVIFTATYFIVFLFFAPISFIEGDVSQALDKALLLANIITAPWFFYWLFHLGANLLSSPKK